MFGVVALRRLPPLKTSVVVCSWFGVVVWLSGLECLEGGTGEKVVRVSCSMARFKL